MAMSCEWRTAKLPYRLQNETHRGKVARQTSQHIEGWDKKTQRRNLKDEDCFDRELWKEKSLGDEENRVFGEFF
jgi:hypothetical protein